MQENNKFNSTTFDMASAVKTMPKFSRDENEDVDTWFIFF